MGLRWFSLPACFTANSMTSNVVTKARHLTRSPLPSSPSNLQVPARERALLTGTFNERIPYLLTRKNKMCNKEYKQFI